MKAARTPLQFEGLGHAPSEAATERSAVFPRQLRLYRFQLAVQRADLRERLMVAIRAERDKHLVNRIEHIARASKRPAQRHPEHLQLNQPAGFCQRMRTERNPAQQVAKPGVEAS